MFVPDSSSKVQSDWMQEYGCALQQACCLSKQKTNVCHCDAEKHLQLVSSVVHNTGGVSECELSSRLATIVDITPWPHDRYSTNMKQDMYDV